MSGAFDDVSFQWQGLTYTIPAGRMMGAIARIEDHVTMPELQRYGERQTIPLVRLSSAFAAVLRYAGVKVADEDVYSAMFGSAESQQDVVAAITVLMTMMVPKGARDRVQKAIEDSQKGNSEPTVNASSKKPSNSRSAQTPDGARQRTSGHSRRRNSTG